MERRSLVSVCHSADEEEEEEIDAVVGDEAGGSAGEGGEEVEVADRLCSAPLSVGGVPDEGIIVGEVGRTQDSV
jgi:hypothetical protein